MKFRKFLSVLATITISSMYFFTATVYAENSKAQELRDLINSNKYYVEYEVNKKEDKRALAVDGNKRKSFDCEGRRSASILRFVPIVGMFAKGDLKLSPEVFYDSNNYYQFIAKKVIIKATPEELQDPYLNPAQDWNTVHKRIVLPEEFGMFTGDETIKFVESGTTTDNGKKTISFDKYLKTIHNVKGANLAKRVYLVYYDEKNNPIKILTLTVDWDEDDTKILADELPKKVTERVYDIQEIKINKFTKELPADVMKFPEGSKVYGPGLGNMDELLDSAPLLEQH